MFQTKEQDKAPEKYLNEMEVRDLPDKEFKIPVIRMLTEVRTAMHEKSKNFNRDRKYKKGSNRNNRAEEYNN